MNIFFFGGTSLAAQDLVASLKKNNKVYIFSRKKKLKKNFYYFDLNKKNNFKFKNLKKNDENYLFFFSSFVPLQEKKSTWNKCYKTNILGLIELLKKNRLKIKKIILASSCSVYGAQNCILTENVFLKPDSFYAISKLAQENILRIFCERNKIKFLCFRLGYVYGKNISKKRIVKKIVSNHKKKEFKIYNKNLNLNLIHTQDIKNFILKAFKRYEGTFNLTNRYETRLIDFYNTVLNKKLNQKMKKNNFSSNKLTKIFPSIKFFPLSSGINELKNDY